MITESLIISIAGCKVTKAKTVGDNWIFWIFIDGFVQIEKIHFEGKYLDIRIVIDSENCLVKFNTQHSEIVQFSEKVALARTQLHFIYDKGVSDNKKSQDIKITQTNATRATGGLRSFRGTAVELVFFPTAIYPVELIRDGHS